MNSGGTCTCAPIVFKDVAGQHFSSSFISLFEYFFLLLSALEIRTEELSRHFSSQNISVKQHCPLPRVKKKSSVSIQTIMVLFELA